MENEEIGICPYCKTFLFAGDIEYRSLRVRIDGVPQWGGVSVYICGKCGKILSIG